MPQIKSIAVTPSRKAGGRRRPSPTVNEGSEELALAPQAQRRAPPRIVALQPTHRYRIGERLRMSNGGRSISRVEAFCKVIATLPYEGHGSLLYRVRSDSEQFERVVAEADLSRKTDSSP
jgi:hypothetical protein